MMSIESNEKSNDSYHCQQISIDGKDAKNLADLVGQVLSHFLVFHFLRPQGPPDIMNHDCRWPTEDHLPAQTTHQHLRASTSSPISTAGPQKQQKNNYDCTPTYTAGYQTIITLKIPPKHFLNKNTIITPMWFSDWKLPPLAILENFQKNIHLSRGSRP